MENNNLIPIYKSVPPFIKFEEGFGYKGVILEDKESGKIQCHLCGKLINSIPKHLYHKHKEKTPDSYRKIVGLGSTTPLVSRSTSKKIKNNFLNLTEEERKKRVALLLSNNKKLHSKNGNYKKRGKDSSIQYQNKFGTCEIQAKEKFFKKYRKLGHIPSIKEMSGSLRSIIYTRFPTYLDALKTWGISEQEYKNHILEGKNNAVIARAENDYFPKYDKETVKNQYMDFFIKNKRLPTWGEVAKLGLPSRVVFNRVFGMNKSDIENTFKVRESY